MQLATRPFLSALQRLDAMSVIQKLKSTLPIGAETGVDKTSYECQDCGNVFESTQDKDRALCTDCTSSDIEQVSTGR